jgi:predicted DNA repair protein MutK
VAQALGRGIVRAAPWLMKALSVAGTAAMFLVGGGILVHGMPALHHAIEACRAQGCWAAGGGAAGAGRRPGRHAAGAVVLAVLTLVHACVQARCAASAPPGGYWPAMPSSSTSNCSVALGGITPPAPRSP